MTQGTPRSVRLLSLAVCAAGLAYLALFLVCAALRIAFPWELEWMEGGMLMHAARVLRGEPIYAPPSLDFVAFFYTPLYSYLVAMLSHVCGGISFALGRAVSLVATLATFGMLFYVARREANTFAGLVAVGLYAALYRTSGTFFDLARVDALALALSLAAALVAYYGRSNGAAATAALLFVAAFLTKQTSAILAPFVGLYLLTVERRRAWVYAATGLSAALAVGLALEHTSDGWFSFYTIHGHQGHAFYADNFWFFYWRDLLFLCPFLILVPVLGLSYGRYTRWGALALAGLLVAAFAERVSTIDYDSHMYYRELWYEKQRYLLVIPPLSIAALLLWARRRARSVLLPPVYFLLLYAGAALASDLNHSTEWAYSNCFMPIALYGSLYVALLFSAFLRSPAEWTAPDRHGAIAVSLALLAQLGALYYEPARQVPRERDRVALERMLKTLEKYPGPVFFPAHPLYSYQRDGTIHVHQMGIGDVDFAGGLQDFEARLASGEFPTVVEESCCDFPELEKDYESVEKFKHGRGALYPPAGFRTRPRTVWVHRARHGSDAARHSRSSP